MREHAVCRSLPCEGACRVRERAVCGSMLCAGACRVRECEGACHVRECEGACRVRERVVCRRVPCAQGVEVSGEAVGSLHSLVPRAHPTPLRGPPLPWEGGDLQRRCLSSKDGPGCFVAATEREAVDETVLLTAQATLSVEEVGPALESRGLGEIRPLAFSDMARRGWEAQRVRRGWEATWREAVDIMVEFELFFFLLSVIGTSWG